MRLYLKTTVFITTLVGIGLFSATARDLRSSDTAEPGTNKAENCEKAPPFDGTGCSPTSFGVQRTAQVEATYSCLGTFGFGFSQRLVPADTGCPDVGFVSPPGSNVEYLFGGAIWVGGVVGQDTLVSVGADGWTIGYEMFPPGWQQAGSVADIEYPTAHSMRAQYSDTFTVGVANDYFGRPHLPLPVEIAMRSHTFEGDDYDEIVIYDMVLTNIGTLTIEDMYVGLYMDADVGWKGYPPNYWDDLTGSIVEDKIAYIIDNDGLNLEGASSCLKALAVKFMGASWPATGMNFNWWISNANPSLDFGPRQLGTPANPFRDFGTGGVGTPEGDVNKYYVMSFPEWDYDQIYTASITDVDPTWMYPLQEVSEQISYGHDARFLLSIGSFDLPPGASERLLFATFTGDSVHVDPDNLANLPDDPDTYLANLNFAHVLANAAWADSMSDSLTNPMMPPIGLRHIGQTATTVTVQWDPWVFDDVTGYELYLDEVPPADMPYPGLAPPWWRPDSWTPVTDVSSDISQYEFTSLDPYKIYAVSLANQTATETGEACAPLFVSLFAGTEGPAVPSEYLFTTEDESVVLKWTAPPDFEVDHYNIYRFDDSATAQLKYRPFYDEGCMSGVIAPVDSFEFPMAGKVYYYYAMEPHAQVAGRSFEWTDPSAAEGVVYCISAVNSYGFETDLSINVTHHIIEPRTKDILVISDVGAVQGGVHEDTIWNFYDDLLVGYSYDFYDRVDSLKPANCPGGELICFDWHDFMRYRLVIIDDDLLSRTLSRQYEDAVRGLTRYLLSGGKLVHFGPMMNVLSWTNSTPFTGQSTDYWFIQRFFGFDSATFMGYLTCPTETWCHQYTGVYGAESELVEMPDLYYDTTRHPFNSFVQTMWPCGKCIPNAGGLLSSEGAEVTHVARTYYPGGSNWDGYPIGIRRSVEGTETYAFGFHLWYMQLGPARELIEAILPPSVRTTIEPDTVYAWMANAIEPQPLNVYLGQFPEGFAAADVDAASLMVNNAVAPTSWSVLSSHPDYVGEVLQLEVSVSDFLDTYGPIWGLGPRQYTVTGQYLRCDSLTAVGVVVLGGHIPGDVTGDGVVDVSDLIHLVDYMFQQGNAPRYPAAADVDANCILDISDLIYLIDYFFTGGAPPRPGCATE